MDEAGQAYGGAPPASVTRGLENLKLALRLRLANRPLSSEQVAAITAALDAAAVAVERTGTTSQVPNGTRSGVSAMNCADAC